MSLWCDLGAYHVVDLILMLEVPHCWNIPVSGEVMSRLSFQVCATLDVFEAFTVKVNSWECGT